MPGPKSNGPRGWLGVDLGIVNIAADSDGVTYSGGQVNGLRKRHAELRARLQSKGTASAKRLLRKRRRKTALPVTSTTASPSGWVAKAKDTGRGIVLEDLKGIRERVTVRKAQRRVQHSWAFHQLGSFIEYKARLAGVPVALIDPRNTSRTCPVCSHVAKANRPTQASFPCVSCGFAGPADTIAAENIRRAVVNQADAGAAYLGPPASPPALAVGS
ncbi:MAG: transposase [Bacillota bacterium]